MIRVSKVSKAYGPIQALTDVNFSIEQGEIVGLLGPNGAGKTTMIKILTGYLQPDTGQVTVDELDVLTQTESVQARIGYLPENAPLYPELSVQGYLKLIADLRQIPPPEQVQCIKEAVYATGLQRRLTQPIGQLSKGFRQRVGLAQAILHKPRLLILDEPTIGLDPTQIVEIRSLIRGLADYSTVLFSSHILSEVETLCDRAIMLMNGQIRADKRMTDLASAGDAVLILERPVGGVREALHNLPIGDGSIESVTEEEANEGGMRYRIRSENGSELCPAVYRLAKEHDWPVREIRSDVRTLESVFNELALAA